jgi:hypothetical protein
MGSKTERSFERVNTALERIIRALVQRRKGRQEIKKYANKKKSEYNMGAAPRKRNSIQGDVEIYSAADLAAGSLAG